MKRLSEVTSEMGATQIVKCIKCGGLMLCSVGQKTKGCPYCGANVNLQKARKIASAKTAFEASEMLRKLKSARKINRKKP